MEQEPVPGASTSSSSAVRGRSPLVPGRVVGRRRQANAAGGRLGGYRVRVTGVEQEQLVALAGRAGVSVPRLLVESALAGGGETPSERHAAMVELFAVRRLLAGVSTNVNQVARHANAGEEFPSEAGAVLAAVRRVVGRLDEALEDLANTAAGAARRARAVARAEERPAAGRLMTPAARTTPAG